MKFQRYVQWLTLERAIEKWDKALTYALLFMAMSLLFALSLKSNNNLLVADNKLSGFVQFANQKPIYLITQKELVTFLLLKFAAFTCFIATSILFANAKQKLFHSAIIIVSSGVLLTWLLQLPLGSVSTIPVIIGLTVVLLMYFINLKFSVSKSINTSAKYLLTYASQSGQAKAVATRFYEANSKLIDLKCASEINPNTLATYSAWLVVASTYGDGTAPDNAHTLLNKLKKVASQLNTPFSILGLGDSRYQAFCGYALSLQTALLESGAKELAPLTKVHRADPLQIKAWWEKVCDVLSLNAVDQHSEYASATIIDNHCLNPSKPTRLVHKLILDVPNAHYAAGDLLDVLPMQSSAYVKKLLAYYEFTGSESVHFQGSMTSVEKALTLCEGILPQKPVTSAQALIDALVPIHPRTYSIASKSNEQPVSLLVRQKTFEQSAAMLPNTNLGLGSSFLCQQSIGNNLSVRVRSHPQFHLPAKPAPLVMIAGGTGIAPFVGMLNELNGKTTCHENWLFFAEQHQDVDDYFDSELTLLQQSGVLTQRIHAWSQSGEKRYIDSALFAHATSLKQLAKSGAYFYLCGALKGFGNSALQALENVLGNPEYASLIKQGRIKRDLY